MQFNITHVMRIPVITYQWITVSRLTLCVQKASHIRYIHCIRCISYICLHVIASSRIRRDDVLVSLLTE